MGWLTLGKRHELVHRPRAPLVPYSHPMAIGRVDQKGVLIGNDPATGQPVFYHGEGSLATIAPQGSGKTQCHMLTNLMAWPGPAIVLDVTGELWRTTSLQRSGFGKVYMINPDDPERSDYYNPLTAIRRDPDHAWDDAQEFANQAFVKEGTGEHFYDRAGTHFLGTCACYVAMYYPEASRNLDAVLALASARDREDFLTAAASKEDIPALQNAAASLLTADEKTRANVEWTAKSALRSWEGANVSRVSRISDWRPENLRRDNTTIYICVSLSRLLTQPGFARVLIGQHIDALCRTQVGQDAPWVQLFVDELPQLRRMAAITKCHEVGRNYNLRLWMIMQYQSQLEEAYGERLAKGMIGSCGLEAYMNPSFKDGTAEYISQRLGMKENLLDQTRRPRVEPNVIAGPAYQDDVIVFPRSADPIRLRKHYYHKNAAMVACEGTLS